MEKIGTLDIEQLRKAVHAALRNWGDPAADQRGVLERLQLLRPAADAKTATPTGKPQTPPIYALLEEGINELAQRREQLASLLRLRFIQGETILFAAHYFHLSQDQINRRQRQAIEQLARLLLQREGWLRGERVQALRAQLPNMGEDARVGMEYARRALHRALQPGSPWLIAIAGLSGSGKTALAASVVHELIPRFEYHDVLWLRGRRLGERAGERAPLAWPQFAASLYAALEPGKGRGPDLERALARLLRSEAKLLVVDGLALERIESEALAQLHDLANPSKIVITSSYFPTGELGLHHFPAPELDLASAREILQRVVGDKVDAAKEIFEYAPELFRLTGGHPLALKVAGRMLDRLPLRAVVDAFARGADPDVGALFQRVYWPSWVRLGEPARGVLRILAARGAGAARYEELSSLTGLPTFELHRVINELSAHSLLRIGGSFADRRYSIRPITRTYIAALPPDP